MWLPSSAGSPTLQFFAVSAATSTASSYTERSTSMRVGALHDWPVLLKQCSAPRFTAFWISASANTMLGDLPPSSSATRLTVSAAAFCTATPARVEPVNDIMSISGWRDMASPTVGPSPLTRLNTPAGKPASSMISANSMALSGAISDGFSTTVQPAATAGTTFSVIWFIGQFHGVIRPHTPTGSWAICSVVILSLSGRSNSKFFTVRMKALMWPQPEAACACVASVIGAPISFEMVFAISAERFS